MRILVILRLGQMLFIVMHFWTMEAVVFQKTMHEARRFAVGHGGAGGYCGQGGSAAVILLFLEYNLKAVMELIFGREAIEVILRVGVSGEHGTNAGQVIDTSESGFESVMPGLSEALYLVAIVEKPVRQCPCLWKV